MTALRIADEVERFHRDQQVAARFWIFLVIFIWPLTWLALLIGLWLFLPLPDALRYVVACGLVGGLAWLGLKHLASLRRRDADRRALFAAETPGEQRFPLAIALADAGGPLAKVLDIVLAAPRLSALGAYCWNDRITWDVAAIAAAQKLIERLGTAGDGWTRWDPTTGEGHLIDGLERLGLVEHQVEGVDISLRLPADMRRRYFPKDPNSTFPGGAIGPVGPVAPFGPGSKP